MSPSPSASICSICLRSCRTATESTSTPRGWSKPWAWTLASSRYTWPRRHCRATLKSTRASLLLPFSGCPGVFQALPVAAGKHAVQTAEQQPAERHPEAVLWTVLLRDSVRRLFLILHSLQWQCSLLADVRRRGLFLQLQPVRTLVSAAVQVLRAGAQHPGSQEPDGVCHGVPEGKSPEACVQIRGSSHHNREAGNPRLTLQSWLPVALQEEKLDGENRYFCESCQSKQSATRRIRLHSLPPTLNLQLMRFVFDRSAATL